MDFFAGMNWQAIGIICGLLILFVLVAVQIKRPLKYNGAQERINKPPFHIFTLESGHGTSFPSKRKRVIASKDVYSRRKKFGQPVLSTTLWAIGIIAVVFFASNFF